MMNIQQVQTPMNTNEKIQAPGLLLQRITGGGLLAAAIGVFMDEILCGACSSGSIGLIPLYLGFLVGSISFVLLIRKILGWMPTLIAALGVAGMFFFMFSYPNGAEGWIGAILIGVAHLFLPLSGRFAAVFWILAGTLGFPEFSARPWGVISAFTMFGAASAASGLFVLWGLPAPSKADSIDES